MSKISTVIDLDIVRQEVASCKAGKENLYHEFDYLNTNVHIPALKKFADRIDNLQPGDSVETLREEFGVALYEVLEEWAYRDSKTLKIAGQEEVEGAGVTNQPEYTGTLGVARKYAQVKSEESKQAFIDFCANITTSHGEEWKHNQVEKVAAISLRALINSKDIEEVKDAFKGAMNAYTNACVKQCSKDIKRDGVVFDIGKNPCVVFDPADLTRDNFPECSEEQLKLIATLYDQGKFMGAVNTIVSNELVKKPNEDGVPNAFLPQAAKVSICIKKDRDGRIYILSTANYYKGYDVYKATINGQEVGQDKATTVTMITDITELKGQTFNPGCASGPATTRIIMTASKEEMASLAIPKTIQAPPTSLDNRLKDAVINLVPLREAYTAEAKKELNDKQKEIVALSQRELERRKFLGVSTDGNPQERLVKYFAMQLKPGTTVNSKHKKQMEEDVMYILTSFVKEDKARQKALKDVAGLMVRDCVTTVSSEDPTVKLSVVEKIRHIVADRLKALFGLSKEKKELRDIVSGHDFAAALKGSLVKPGEAQSHGTLPYKTDSSTALRR